MPSNFTSLTVTWFDDSDGYATSEDVTTDVLSIPLFTDTGSGEVNEAELQMSAKGGLHVHVGTSVIEEFDRFRIECTDLGGNTYDRYFEVQDIIPSTSKTEGSILTIRCLGIEYHTQMIHYSSRLWFTNAHRVAKEIGNLYEDNNGSRQPLIARHDDTSYSTSNKYGNGLPRTTNNHYEFGTAEDTCYNRLVNVIDLLGGAVGAGGDGEFYEIGFDTPAVNQIDAAFFVSGARSIDGNDTSNDSSLTTIENTTSINLSEQEGGLANPTGTNVLAWGSPNHGSLPVDFSEYRSKELEFLYRPVWKSGLTYKQNSKVVHAASGKHYSSDIDNNTSTPPTNWTQIDMGTEFGDSVQYSPWTDDKAVLWANSGSDPDGLTTFAAWATSTAYDIGDVVTQGGSQYVALEGHTSGTFATDLSNGKWEQVDNGKLGNGAGFFDSNLVIDDTIRRTWATERIGDFDYDTVNDSAGNANYLYDNSEWAIGHRMLNFSDTSISGTDRNNVNMKDSILERDVTRNDDHAGTEWFAKIKPDSTTDRMQVAVIDEGKMFEWNDTAAQWQEITTSTYGNDCFHEYHAIYNVKGVDPRPTEDDSTKYPEVTSDGNPFSTNIRSAVEVVYKFSTIDNFPTSAAGYKKGAWISWSLPFPVNTYNSISEGVGDLYGGGTNEGPGGGPTYPAFLDFQNMTYTHDNKLGFNQGDSSEDLGPISSIAFFTRVGIWDVSNNSLDGIVTLRVTLYDRNDHVVTQDTEVRFTDGRTWQEINLPISGFSIYRAREPKSVALRALSIVGYEVPLKERDIQDIFEFRHVKHISIQIQDFYDEDGRYAPEKNLLAFSNTGFQTNAGGTIKLAVDGFHFKKTLLVTSGQDTTRNIEPTFVQLPNIISYTQLKNVVNSDLEIHKFKHKEFNFQTSGDSIFDLRFGDMVFLKNPDIISDQDDTSDATARKIKLVCKRIEYHLTKPRVGPGGLTRTIKGVKRFSS